MDSHKLVFSLFLLFSLILTGYNGVEGKEENKKRWRATKLFVFGDSYSDTGNDNKSKINSWNIPYGITFPGKPTGRFSDGRILTDFLATHMRIVSPIPYEKRLKRSKSEWENGMNFAYGGTGVFKTDVNDPNMTTQIHLFQRILRLNRQIYSRQELKNSALALVTSSGNDYSYYIQSKGSTIQGLTALIPKVVDQVANNLKRIHELGVRKVAVISQQPLGCLPKITAETSYTKCNATYQQLVHLHNSYLYATVSDLNNHTKNSTFYILDLYNAFNSILFNNTGTKKFENPLKPCCIGLGDGYCGLVENKRKKYGLCENRNSTFFWDLVHPTQAGWSAVFDFLLPIFNQIMS